MNKAIVPCVSGRRCKKWRICNVCARIRQAQIATVAENGALADKFTSIAVIRPFSESTLSKDKTKLVSELQKKTKGGIWTVEEGVELGGMHINMLLGSENELDAGLLGDLWAEKVGNEADVWLKPVEKSDIRRVAAYISKKEQFPDKDRYPARLYGSWGGWKRPLGALAEGNAAIPAVLAVETMLDNAGIALSPLGKAETHQEMVKRQALNAQERTKSKVKSLMTRVLAASADEILTKGFVYVSGHGIKTLADLRDYGIISQERFDELNQDGE